MENSFHFYTKQKFNRTNAFVQLKRLFDKNIHSCLDKKQRISIDVVLFVS